MIWSIHLFIVTPFLSKFYMVFTGMSFVEKIVWIRILFCLSPFNFHINIYIDSNLINWYLNDWNFTDSYSNESKHLNWREFNFHHSFLKWRYIWAQNWSIASDVIKVINEIWSMIGEESDFSEIDILTFTTYINSHSFDINLKNISNWYEWNLLGGEEYSTINS